MAMYRVSLNILFVAGCVLPVAASVSSAQAPAVRAVTQPAIPSVTQAPNAETSAAAASLKVSLRLEDEGPFVGAAEVRLMPSEGYEIIGMPTGGEGETEFMGLAPGKYSVEVSAPGYLSVRLHTEIEAGHRERILYVVMKPRAMARREEKAPELIPEGKETPAGGNALVGASKMGGAEEVRLWVDHELETNVPPVDPNVECPGPQVLKGVGQRMKELVSNLEKFTATEVVEHYKRVSGKEEERPQMRRFGYVVLVSQNREGTFLVDEYRDGSVDATIFPEGIATNGLPALALLFHPVLAVDFDFTCEGLGLAKGKAAWQIHFAQRGDRAVRIRGYNTGQRTYRLYLEGRAWIDAGNYQVVRMESELQKPIPDIELTKEHIVIEYAPVRFQTQKTQLWLPQVAEMYVEKNHHRYYRRHTYSDFKLFSVETAQNIGAPKGSYSFTNMSDQEVRGVLMVMPEEEAKRAPVRLEVVVPARGRVFKVVGPGKDVSLPIAAVASATFVHNGKAEAVKVEADLVKETTLDVIPETAVERQGF